MERWVGKVCVITGASSGIGAQAAKTLAEKGLIVVGLARRAEKIQNFSKTSKGKIHAVKCDVSKEEDILNAFKWIESTLGGVDVLINSAGVINAAFLVTGSSKEFKDVMDTNVFGLCICTREAIRSMRKRGDDGQIIHLNSAVGHAVPQLHGFPMGTYPASKYGVTALTEGLRIELQALNSGIKVSSISPGLVSTAMTEHFTQAMKINNSETYNSWVLKESDIVETILYILCTRPGVQIHDIMIFPIQKAEDTEKLMAGQKH